MNIEKKNIVLISLMDKNVASAAFRGWWYVPSLRMMVSIPIDHFQLYETEFSFLLFIHSFNVACMQWWSVDFSLLTLRWIEWSEIPHTFHLEPSLWIHYVCLCYFLHLCLTSWEAQNDSIHSQVHYLVCTSLIITVLYLFTLFLFVVLMNPRPTKPTCQGFYPFIIWSTLLSLPGYALLILFGIDDVHGL